MGRGIILVNLLVVLGISACTSSKTTTPRGFDANGAIEQQYFVGGGAEINWTADESGSAFLIERGSETIIVTRTLNRGESFTSGTDEVELAAQQTGAAREDIRLDLYFVPNK